MPSRSRAARAPELPLTQALALGALHGPAELLPISSSGHVALLPWLRGWPMAGLDPALRKTFEVALHAGTAAALLITLRKEVVEVVLDLDRRRLTLIGLSFLPPAAVGLLLEGPIEEHLGTPATIAAGLLVGGVAMAAADRRAGGRRYSEAGIADAVWLGVAQSCALMPGVSRGGATLTVARWRGFRPPDASLLSRHTALPVIAGASLLKTVRLARRGLPEGLGTALLAGTAASFASTFAFGRVLSRHQAGGWLRIWGLYRMALAAWVGVRLRSGGCGRMGA